MLRLHRTTREHLVDQFALSIVIVGNRTGVIRRADGLFRISAAIASAIGVMARPPNTLRADPCVAAFFAWSCKE